MQTCTLSLGNLQICTSHSHLGDRLWPEAFPSPEGFIAVKYRHRKRKMFFKNIFLTISVVLSRAFEVAPSKRVNRFRICQAPRQRYGWGYWYQNYNSSFVKIVHIFTEMSGCASLSYKHIVRRHRISEHTPHTRTDSRTPYVYTVWCLFYSFVFT